MGQSDPSVDTSKPHTNVIPGRALQTQRYDTFFSVFYASLL